MWTLEKPYIFAFKGIHTPHAPHKERKVLQKENNLTMEEKKLFLSAPVLAYPPDRRTDREEFLNLTASPRTLHQFPLLQ